MTRKVVVFARDDDLHADAVIDHCLRQGIEVIRMDVRRILGGDLSIGIEFECKTRAFALTLGERSIFDKDEVGVFCRDFELPAVPSIENLNECVALEEARCVLNGWANAIPRERWIDHPIVQAEYDNKPLQLAIAQVVGLRVPRTLITNQPAKAKEFANANRVVIKQLSNLSFVGIDNASECIYTSPVQDSVWEYAEEVRACPIMLQERINKIADIRVTVVGTEIFPAKIASKSDDPNVVDFRARTEEHIDVVAIPDRLMAAVTSMTRRMGLQYAAFDFGLTPEGDYVFFEANVAGNWLWIEQATGLPISKSLADHLYGLAES